MSLRESNGMRTRLLEKEQNRGQGKQKWNLTLNRHTQRRLMSSQLTLIGLNLTVTQETILEKSLTNMSLIKSTVCLSHSHLHNNCKMHY
jgi:hypothetical protein